MFLVTFASFFFFLPWCMKAHPNFKSNLKLNFYIAMFDFILSSLKLYGEHADCFHKKKKKLNQKTFYLIVLC